MPSYRWSLPLIALLVGFADGQGSGRQGNRGADRGGAKPSRQIVRAADKERDEEITGEEWAAFLASLEAGPGGELDPVRLKARILVPMLDIDDDDVVTLDDAMLIFKTLDRNQDYQIAKEEFPEATFGTGANANASAISTRRRATPFMASMPVHLADADGDDKVIEEEWWPFVDGVEIDEEGAITEAALATWWADTCRVMADKEGFTQGSFLTYIEKGLDDKEDGALTLDDLQSLFDRLDSDGDGAISKEEMSFTFESFTPTEFERNQPPLMPWQRSLHDALALVEATGRPLLICVNMDGEMASESLAYRRYRDPEFVALARNFVPLLVSPNRRNPVDYDDRGRRILDQKFGRLTSAEHIDIESALFERYFGGRRTAPRHIAVDRDGNMLFDIFLENDLKKIDEALRTHGLPGPEAADPATLSEEELFASPDASHRAWLEAAFLAADVPARVRMTGMAFSKERRTQHPEVLRLALADPAPEVRGGATRAIAEHPEQAPLDFFVAATVDGPPPPPILERLLDGLRARAATESDEATGTRARRLQAGLDGLNAPSAEIDVARWQVALSWAPSPGEGAPVSRDILAQRLAEFEERMTAYLDDPELNLAFAAATMEFAQLQILENRDPYFFLEDVVAAAGRATSEGQPDGRALAFLAWGSYLLLDMEAAGTYSVQAVRNLLPWAGTALAARALEILADTRIRAIYERMQARGEWPAAWAADVRAAHAVLLEHPQGTEEQALSYLAFLDTLEAVGEAKRFLRVALERFPTSGRLHAHLRSRALRAAGLDTLLGIYAELELESRDPAALRWYEGLAWLVAAERHVEQRAPGAALDAYLESIRAFRGSTGSQADYEESANHYICLALAGITRLHLEGQRWEDALAAMRESVASSPKSLWAFDGLANTPIETARLLYRSLVDAEREEEAVQLREFLGQNDIELEPPTR